MDQKLFNRKYLLQSIILMSLFRTFDNIRVYSVSSWASRNDAPEAHFTNADWLKSSMG